MKKCKATTQIGAADFVTIEYSCGQREGHQGAHSAKTKDIDTGRTVIIQWSSLKHAMELLQNAAENL